MNLSMILIPIINPLVDELLRFWKALTLIFIPFLARSLSSVHSSALHVIFQQGGKFVVFQAIQLIVDAHGVLSNFLAVLGQWTILDLSVKSGLLDLVQHIAKLLVVLKFFKLKLNRLLKNLLLGVGILS